MSVSPEEVERVLDEMGLLDEIASARLRADSIGRNADLAYAVRWSVMNHDVRKIWLPDDLRYHGEIGVPEQLYFVRNARRVTGAKVVARGGEITIGGVKGAIGERTVRLDSFALLERWAAEEGGGRRFVLDAGWQAYLVDDAQLAAIRRHQVARLRTIHPAEMARRATEAANALRAIGVDPGPGNGVDVGLAVDDRDVVTAVLCASKLGAPAADAGARLVPQIDRLAQKADRDAPRLELAQNFLETTVIVRHRGAETRLGTLPWEDLGRFLGELAAATPDWPYRIVAVRDPHRRGKLLVVPAASVSPLAGLAHVL